MAIRGAGILPASSRSATFACGPDTRTIEIAVGGRPEDRAKIVWSRGCMAYLSAQRGGCNGIFVQTPLSANNTNPDTGFSSW